jgi:serine protease
MSRAAAINGVTRRLSAAAGVKVAFDTDMFADAALFDTGSLDVDTVERAAAAIAAMDDVEYASPDYWRTIDRRPAQQDDGKKPAQGGISVFLPLSSKNYVAPANDALRGEQWHYDSPAGGDYGIDLQNAWGLTTGSRNVVVAVVDTGSLYGHPDLAGRLLPGYDFVTNPFVAGDGGGRDGDAADPGDFVTQAEIDDSATPFNQDCLSDSSWHGTHVAGTIGAATNNLIGVSGIDQNARILTARGLGKCGGFDSDIIAAVRWAAGLPVAGVPANPTPARVINMSLGGSGACTTAWQDAINEVVARNVIVVVAAGNANRNASNDSPGNCANVITVAATTRLGSRANYSNYGSLVEIAAPGGSASSNFDPDGVLSTLNEGTTTPGAHSYAFYQGTSMAAPHVSGVVSLMLGKNPNLTLGQVSTIMRQNATAFPTGSTCNTTLCGAGIVNAYKALQATP